ncbi:hypothetical protein [Butyrivibrio sp. AC2005]|uniref:hypothetical protein n=1 Tax=Butyrivibrio sp. AC2005 TaxID=1280672 RepID=UPI00040AB49F|nr:hypothetical protein [Butyrivibrio sp. AC2005]
MKYIGIDCKNTGELFVQEFGTKKEAISVAKKAWNALAEFQKSIRDNFYVIESIDPDEESKRHLDGDLIIAFKINGAET